jgi:hypothetical protein
MAQAMAMPTGSFVAQPGYSSAGYSGSYGAAPQAATYGFGGYGGAYGNSYGGASYSGYGGASSYGGSYPVSQMPSQGSFVASQPSFTYGSGGAYENPSLGYNQYQPYQYGQTAGYGSMSYGAPAYGAQSYGAQSYGAQSYGAPTFGGMSSGMPSYGTPGFGSAGFGTGTTDLTGMGMDTAPVADKKPEAGKKKRAVNVPPKKKSVCC